MKIAVLNGSPKGNLSVTMQYVNFLQKRFPCHELKIFNIASTIKQIENNEKAFQEIIKEVRSSDGVLWAFPLYFLLVSSQYKRFIELLWERETTEVFKNKYTAVFSTSIHFFDHTAHEYMNAICDDLDMNYLGSFSAGMYDLLNERERERWAIFASEFFEGIQTCAPTSKRFLPIVDRAFDYTPGSVRQKTSTLGKRVQILTDLTDPQANLSKMIERFKEAFAEEVEVTNLHHLDIKGGCLGCLQCGYDYRCSYGDQDNYVQFYRNQVQKPDILIFAGAIRDRYLSSIWKMFFDRSFFHTHTPSLRGKQVGVLLSGPLKQIPNLRQILEAYTEFQQANLVDIITDEVEDANALDAQLEHLAQRVIHLAEKNYKKPNTFLGVGGMKIFRDDVWGKLRFPFQADHRFYKKHGFYDFPQRDYRTRTRVTLLTLLTKIPKIRREIYRKRMREEMIKPLQKIVQGVGTGIPSKN